MTTATFTLVFASVWLLCGTVLIVRVLKGSPELVRRLFIVPAWARLAALFVAICVAPSVFIVHVIYWLKN